MAKRIPSSYPFNTDATEKSRPLPARPLLTPANIENSFQTHPLDKPAPRDYSVKPFVNLIFALDAAFDLREIPVNGTCFWVSSSDNTAFVRINIGAANPGGQASTRGIVVRNGFRLSGIKFDRLYVTNSSAQAGLTIEVTISRDFPDDRIDVNL